MNTFFLIIKKYFTITDNGFQNLDSLQKIIYFMFINKKYSREVKFNYFIEQINNIFLTREQKEDFINQSGSSYSGWLSLKPGRYVVLHDLSGNPNDEVMVGIEDEQKEMCRYHANRGFLQIHYPDMPFHITNEKTCRLFLKLLKSNSETHCPPVSVTLFKMTDILSERISPINYLIA